MREWRGVGDQNSRKGGNHLSQAALYAKNCAQVLYFAVVVLCIYLLGCIGSSLWHSGSPLCHWDLVVQHLDSPVVHRNLSYPWPWAILVPQPGIKPMSSAMQGRFSTTWPPGKSRMLRCFGCVITIPSHKLCGVSFILTLMRINLKTWCQALHYMTGRPWAESFSLSGSLISFGK